MSRTQDPMPGPASEQEQPTAATTASPPSRSAETQRAGRDDPGLDVGGPGAAERSGSTPSWRSTIETIGSVVAPTTLIGALLYYFGWARTNALYASFGVDASALGFSIQDYVLRSTDATYVPLGALGILILLALWAHVTIRSWTMGRRRRWGGEVIAPAAIAIGLVAFLRGILGVVHPLWDDFLVTPLCLAAGVALLGYGAHLRRRLRTPKAGEYRPTDPSWFAPAHITLVVLLVVLSLFWATEVYAQAFGRGRAQQIAAAVTSRPAVTVYSSSRLHIDSPVVEEHDLGRSYAPHRFRYTGLRLLIRSGGKYFLLPSDWSPPNSVTVVLPDTDAVRLEFRPAGG
jgi:uncharacterized membrane protein YidH (DUF202 family)